jgi:hypothetical protein
MNLAFLILSLLLPPVEMHSNVVGQIQVDNFGNELFLVATMDKRPLTVALMNEGDCAPQDMLRVCGNEYLQEHIQFFVNGEKVRPELQRMDMEKEHLVFNYYIPSIGTLENLKVISDYMISYHDLSEVKFNLTIQQLSKQFTLSQNKKEIHLKL